MPRRSSRFHGAPVRAQKKLDHTRWDLSTGSFSAQSAATAAINFSSVGTTPATLLRIRGEVFGWNDAASTPPKSIQCTYGIILVPEGTGTTVLFDPVSDGNAPWLLWGTAHLGYEEMVTDVVDVPGLTSFRHVIDNKAMRIIRPDIEMQFVMTNTTVGGSGNMNVAYSLRWLLGF